MTHPTTPSDLDSRLAVLATAAADPPPSIAQRALLLKCLADRLDANRDELVPIAQRETRLGLDRLAGEVARTTGQLRFLAEVLREGSWLDATIDTEDVRADGASPDIRSLNAPLGVALVFAASNFPFAFSVVGGDTAAALAAGCPVLVKAHPGHPELSTRVGALAKEVFGSSFALVSGWEAGRDAIVDPRVKVAAFTGSVAGGRALLELANRRPDPIPFYGELGSVNPVFVSPGAAKARKQEIADGFVASFTLGGGQFCTKPGILFAPRTSGLVQQIGVVTQGVNGTPMLGDWVHDGHAARRQALLSIPEVRAVVDPGTDSADCARPMVVATSAQQFLEAPAALLEECFGPTTVLVEYDDLDELRHAAMALSGSLTATVHAEADEEPALRSLIHALQLVAGRLVWNGWPTGVRVSWAMQHGGPWPASTASGFTSVGAASLRRFLRPVAFQNAPDAVLPAPVRDRNELQIPRRINGTPTLRDVRRART